MLARIFAMSPGDASSAQRRREMALLEQWRRGIEAQQASYLAEDDRAQRQARVGEGDFMEPTVDWVASHHGVSNRAAYEQVQLGHRLSLLPHTARQFQEGRINGPQARAICDAMSQLERCRQGDDGRVREEVEAELNQKAETMTARELYKEWARKRYQLDQEAGLAAERSERERSWAYLGQTPQGRELVSADLDTETGTLFRTAVSAFSRKRGKDDERPAKLRRAQALGEIARLALQSEKAPATAGSPTRLVVRCPVETLTLKPGSPPAELDGGGVISGERARRLMCDATVTRVYVDRDSGDVIQVGASTRVVPPRMRAALEERDRTCRHPGCDVPASRCIPHHREHVADGGKTTMPNLIMLCEVHHPQGHPENARFHKRHGSAPPGPAP